MLYVINTVFVHEVPRSRVLSAAVDPGLEIELADGGNRTVRTTTTTFDAAGRVESSATEVADPLGSTAVPESRTVYDPATGAVTATVAVTDGVETGRISSTYDLWGRQVTY